MGESLWYLPKPRTWPPTRFVVDYLFKVSQRHFEVKIFVLPEAFTCRGKPRIEESYPTFPRLLSTEITDPT